MTQYLSWRGAELDPGWQGITHLTLDTTVPGFVAVVTAHLARPASGMTADGVRVEGGRRIVVPTSDLVPGTAPIVLPAPEILLTNGDQFFVVRFVERGDHSPYTVRLLDGGSDPVHPFFAEAQFTFFIDCESGDCRPTGRLPIERPDTPPAVDTRAKDFRGFMRMLSEWARVTNPDWADLAPASQERLLMELVAHQGDMLSYYQDRVANEAFLATASERYSLRQHATLLGHRVFDGRAARTTLAFDVTVAGFVPAGVSIENRRLHGERPVVFYVRERTRVDPGHNSSALVVAAWPGALSATIPAGTTSMLLWGQTYALMAGMPFAFVQGPLAQLVTLTRVRLVSLPGWTSDPSLPLVNLNQPLTEITFEPALPRELRPWDPETPLRLYANLAAARHGARRVSWINPAASAGPGNPQPSADDVIVALDQRNRVVLPVPRGGATVWHLRALEVPEGPVVHETDSHGRSGPVIDVFVDGERWEREEHLHASESFDLHYVASTDNAGRLWLEFGDGVHGRAIEVDPATLEPLVTIRMVYRIGEPLDGNCARDTLTEVVRPADPGFDVLGVLAITNVTPGEGGRRKDTLDEIREAVPMSLVHGDLERAVSLADYAAIARTVPGVSRAAAKAIGGPFNTVLVLVDAGEQAALTPELRGRVEQRIEETRMAGREHVVRAAEYVPLAVRLVLCIQPGFLRHEVRDRVLAELRPARTGRGGFFHPDNLTFGQDLEAGDLIAFVQAIPGVRSVKLTRFCRLSAETPSVEDRIDLGPTEVARLDADEDFPEHGELRVGVVGLDVVDEAELDDFLVDVAGGAP